MKYLISIVACYVGFLAFAAEEPNDKAGKYHAMLEKRPSSGYLFDRFYNAWLDTGSIEGLGEFLKNETEADDAALGDRLLLAWFYAKQGEDAGALEVFKQALKEAPENAEAWYEKAKIEARTLNFEAAVADLDKAVEAGAKAELAIRIAKLKGQLLIRDGKNEAALAAWKSLLSKNDDDEELYEDVIEIQIEEGLYDDAIATSKSLVELTKDPYKKVLRQLRMGDVFQRAGQRDEALASYESSLKQVGNGTWIEKEILSQVERVFRREDDVSGLAARLKSLAGADGKRISIQRRYAEVLMEIGQEDEAVTLFEKIITLTPGDRSVREEYIDLLSEAGRYEKAIPQLEALIAQNAQDGELLIRLAALQDAADNKTEAGATLRKFLAQSDGSEYAHLRVARLEEQYDLMEEAEVTYQKILEAFPESVASQETFAAFLHRLDRKEEALDLWKKIAESGDRAQAIRIARTLASRMEHEAAFAVLQARFDELKNDPVFLGQLIVEAVVLKKIEEAVPWTFQRINLIDEPIDLEAAIKQATQVIGKSEKRPDLILSLEENSNRTLQETCLLAELLEIDAKYDAVDALLVESEHAGELLILNQRIRSLMARELWEKAAEATKDLIEGQGGRKSLFVRNLVHLYERAGKTTEALKWLPEWKTMSPGSIEPWLTEANLLRSERKAEEAIKVLRLAANKFEGDTTILSELAQVYTEDGKSADAQRIYQRLYDEGETLTDKLQWVARLAGTAQNLGKLDSLIEDYKDRQRSNRESIAPLMALAEMHRTTGDYEERRKALMEAARLKPDDIGFLLEVARMEEAEGDWNAGLATLEKAQKIENSVSVREKIAAIKLRNGDEESGYQELAALAKEKMDADRVLKLAEAITTRYAWERLNTFLEPWMIEFPKDYRLHYLRAVALEESGEPLAAAEVFLSLLDFDEEVKGNLAIDPLKRTMAQKTTTAPEGMIDFYRFRQSISQAYRYRQTRNQNFIIFGGIRGTGQTVMLPATIDYVSSYAMAHLSGLMISLDEKDVTEITEKLNTSGKKNASLFSKLTYDPQRHSFQIPDELVDDNPNNEALLAYWLEVNQYNVTTELSRFQKAFDLLGKKYPRYGVMAALGGARLMDEESPAMLTNAVGILKEIDNPDYTVFSILARLVTQSLSNQAQGIELTKSQRDELIDLTLSWYPRVMEQPGVNQAYVFRNTATMLRNANRGDEFLELVDARIAELARKKAFSSAYTYRGNQSQRMITPLPFPNSKLSLVPQEVSQLFPPNQNSVVYLALERESREPETPLDLAEKAKHPIVKLLLMIQGSAEDEAIAKIVDSLVSEDKPTLDSSMLAAGWAARQGKNEKVITLLSKAKFLPMSRTQRQELDSAIVHAAIELGEENQAALEAGRAAALRLRHGRLFGNQLQELAGALQSLGLDKEAEQQEEKLANTMSRSPATIRGSYSTGMGFVQPGNNQNRVQQLISQGKRDQAIKEAAQTMLQWGLSAAIPQNGNNWEYYSREHKTQLARLNLMSDVLTYIEGSKRNSKKEQLEYAGVQLIMGEKETALATYQEVLKQHPGESGARIQSAILLAETDVEAAEEMISKIDSNFKQQIGTVLSQKINNYNGEDFETQMSTIRLVKGLLEGIENPERIDFSWVVQPLRWLVTNQSSGDISLSHLYSTSTKRKELKLEREESKPSAENKAQFEIAEALNQRRRQMHDEYCELMLKIPQLAASGFTCSRAIALANGESNDSFRPLAIEALKLAAGSPPKRDVQVESYLKSDETVELLDPYYFLAKALWEKNNQEELNEKLIPEIKREGRNGRSISRRLEMLAKLYFDEEAKFATNMKFYFNAVGSFGVNTSNEFPKLVEVMRARKLSTEQVHKILKERAQVLFNQNNRPGQPETELIELIYERDGKEAAELALENLADIWLGPREKRKQYIADNYNPQNRNGSIQSRNIYNFSYSMRTVTEREKLTFLGLDFCERYGIPREGWPYFFRRSNNYSDADKIMTWLKKSPFLNEATANFVFYMAPKSRQTSGRASVFEEVIYGIRNYANDETRKALAIDLEQENGLGSQLITSVATNRNQPENFLNVGAKFKSDIEELEDTEARLNWIRFFETQRASVSKDFKWPDDTKPFVAFITESGSGLTNEKAEELLAAKSYQELKLNSNPYNFSGYVAGLMRGIEKEDSSQTKAIFYKACDLVAAEQKSRQGWQGRGTSDGSNFAFELLRYYSNGSADLERLKIITDIITDSDRLSIPVNGTPGSLNLNSILRAEFDRIKNDGLKDKPVLALEKLFQRLNEKIDSKAIPIVSNDFIRFASQLSTDEKKVILEFCDANDEKSPVSNWVTEFGMAIRNDCFENSDSKKRYLKTADAKISDPDAFFDHYQKQLSDESYPPQLRLLTANFNLEKSKQWPDSYIDEAFTLLTETLSTGDISIQGSSFYRIANGFSELPNTDSRTELAGKFLTAWKERNRYNRSGSKNGKAFNPSGSSVIAAFRVAAAANRKDVINRMFIQHSNYLVNSTPVLIQLVKHGHFETAAKQFKKQFFNYKPSTSSTYPYDEEWAAEIPKFTALLPDEDQRFLAKVLLQLTADPKSKPPGNSTSKDKLTPHATRAVELANELKSISFSNQSVKERCITFLVKEDEAAKILSGDLAGIFEKINFNALGSIDDYDLIRQAIQIPMIHALNEIEKGNAKPLMSLWKGIVGGSAQSYYLAESLNPVVQEMNQQILKSAGTPDVASAWLMVLETVHESTPNDLYNRLNDFSKSTSEHVILAIALGKDDRLNEWLQEIPEARSNWFKENVKKSAMLIPTLRRVINPTNKAITDIDADYRLALIKKYISSPFVHEIHPYHATTLTMIVKGCMTSDELFENKNEFLKLYPRGGLEYVDLANAYEDANKFTDALAVLETGIKKSKPVKNRLNRFMIQRATNLSQLDRKPEAIAALKMVNIVDFDTSTRKAFEKLAKDLKYEIPKAKP